MRPNFAKYSKRCQDSRLKLAWHVHLLVYFTCLQVQSKFEPDLFSKILPTLHQPDTLVMALYVRTGRTDHVAGMKDKPGGVPAEDASRALYGAKKIIQCAERLEQEYLSKQVLLSNCLVPGDRLDISQTMVASLVRYSSKQDDWYSTTTGGDDSFSWSSYETKARTIDCRLCRGIDRLVSHWRIRLGDYRHEFS